MKKFLLLFLFFAHPAAALEGGASTSAVEVRTSFSGAELTIFGALKRDYGALDKILILVEGPERTMTLWQKKRVAGVWANRNPKTFEKVHGFYYLVGTGMVEEIARTRILQSIKNEQDKSHVKRLLGQRELFSTHPNQIELLGKRLFKAQIKLPTLAPIGDYNIRLMHFNQRGVLEETSLPLKLSKRGFGQTLFWLAREWAFFYGLLAVGLALFMGWSITELLRRLTL